LNKPLLEIEVDQVESAGALILENGYEIMAQTKSKISIPYASAAESGIVNTLLIKNGFTVTSLSMQKKDLENLFLDITKTD
jgi:ABC-2 type transport system ATP-binding protein